MNRQAEKLRTSVSERLGVDLDQLVLCFAGPSYWLWVAGAAIFGVLLYAVIGLGGAVGGALIGLVLGSWFLVVTPFVVGTTDSELVMVEMTQPFFGTQKAESISHREPLAEASFQKQGRALVFAGRRLQILPFWGGRAEAVSSAITS